MCSKLLRSESSVQIHGRPRSRRFLQIDGGCVPLAAKKGIAISLAHTMAVILAIACNIPLLQVEARLCTLECG